MARKKRDKGKSEDLQGFKYFKILSGILESLHDAGCERDRAHNRTLHMDQYMTLLLMYMFNPVCASLRALQEASDLKKVQRVLKGCPPGCRWCHNCEGMDPRPQVASFAHKCLHCGECVTACPRGAPTLADTTPDVEPPFAAAMAALSGRLAEASGQVVR
ncbi:MAG: 4Fe-4S binding protein [Planctomycetota bacterium]